MHRSLLRTKLAESRSKVTNRVTQRAKSLVPIQVDSPHNCIVCGRKMRSWRGGGGDGRVCSPNCARKWADS
ncbi:hypothetical protein [Actinopolyspora mortivallis]|uniref:hypothetical protein n=1 Tax=Actinopolyspora mortivallis TaxID=33906 RepID=UPI000362FBB1|nr:hypothetical protein [Actinopolyspora mortivallis]